MGNFNLIQDKINLTTQNLNLISDNLANINTPEYKRKYIDVQGNSFSSALKTSVKKTKDKHLDGSNGFDGSVIEETTFVRTDENGVDIDKEILEMNKNKIYYNSLINFLNGDISKNKMIITSK